MEQRLVIFESLGYKGDIPEVQAYLNDGWKIDKFTAVEYDGDLKIIILFVR